MIKLLNYIRKYFLYKKHSKSCICDRHTIFTKHTRINLLWGAIKENIKVGSFCRIYGSLSACHNGVIILGNHVAIGPGSRVMAVNKVIIEDYTETGPNITICDNNNHPVNPEDRMVMRMTPARSIERSWLFSENRPIHIGKNVWIGENSRICKGVTIGDNAVIAACSVVTKDVPANCIAAGNPAKIVKTDIDNLPRLLKKRQSNNID